MFLYQPWNRELSVFASLDLEKDEIRIPKSSGVIGWVFEHRQPVILNNVYEDWRFYKGVDDVTGFHTQNMICAPLIDNKNSCLGTLQSLNKKNGYFTDEDMELLAVTARIVAVSINNSRRYIEKSVTNEARKRFIDQIVGNIDNLIERQQVYSY